jgi:predicted AlkP superfamily pyrophosphatase or phosphodiesterase
MRLVFVVLPTVVLLLSGCASAARESPSAPVAPVTEAPRVPLVVILVVDQMRADYFDLYGAHFTAGLKRLSDEGARFPRAAYPYLNTVTCAGHSTIGTGALPYRHGMVLNAWWDRTTARSQPCTSDPSEKNIAYTGTVTGGESADALLVPPLGEQIRAAGGQTVAMSLKPRSAITMAGKHPTAVVWFHERAGWTTSSAFTEAPVEWLKAYFDANPFGNDRGKVWNLLLPPASYTGEDDAPGERMPSGWSRVFPHELGAPPEQFNTHWQRSPFADEYLGRLAAHAIDRLNLGRGQGTDFLSVSFSTLDLAGHQYGPASHEVQDVLFRLDRTIGTLLDHLDARVGRGRYVVALSADHGVAPLPEQSGGKRQPSSEIVATIDAALAPFFGPGKYVAHTVYTDLYLAPGIYDRLKRTPVASKAVLEALRAMPGIAHAFRADDLDGPSARSSNDPALRAAALNYYAPRSGDLIVVPEKNWLLSTAATTHGTLYPYDQQVPVIFFGAGVTPGVFDTPATPADIAPTLAAIAGVRFEATDGKVLLRR